MDFILDLNHKETTTRRHQFKYFVSSCLGGILLNALAHAPRVKAADLAPEFVAVCIEEDKGGGEAEVVKGSQLTSGRFLDVQTDNPYFVFQFILEPVYDGFDPRAG
jgi:hypothetical protein